MRGFRPRWAVRSLQRKFLVAVVLVIAVVMATVIVVVEHRQRATIIDEVRERGSVIARNLANIASGALIVYNFTALEQYVVRVASEPDVVYAIVLDADGRVAAHSEAPDRVGFLLEGPIDERAAGTDVALVQDAIGQGGEPLYDFVVPVIVNGHKWGAVRVGFSKRRTEDAIRETRRELGLFSAAALLVGALAAAVVAGRIARPVRQLAAGVVAISRGDFDQRIEPATRDEIGELARAFNHMAAQLRAQRSALEEANEELRRRFEELGDLKHYTDSVLRSLTSGVLTVDLEGRIVTLNPAAELLTGYFSGEAAGRYCTEVFAHTPEVGELLMDALTSRTGFRGHPLVLRRRNGSATEVEFSVTPLRGAEGKDLGVLGMFRDLTPVRELESQLRRSDRLALIGTLAAGLAHEIKNPLTSVLTFTRHLERRFADEQFRERFQRVVPHELERINAIVERLLELARPRELELSLVRVPALMDRAVDLHGNVVDAKQIRVVREYARDLLRVEADAEALYRGLVNLVGNAVEAVGVGGRLTLRVGWQETGRAHGWLRHRAICIEIEDDGPGIDPEDADRIFTPFFTTKERGTGLGLAITHKIVEDHGGVIDFRPAAGRGAIFRVLLPWRGERGLGARDTSERDR